MREPAIPTLLLVPSDDPHDPEALYAIATAYAHAGHIVSAHGNESDQIAFTFPAIVCSSFALELFLKFFQMVDLIERGETTKKIKFDHTIPGLWGKLTPTTRQSLPGCFATPQVSLTPRGKTFVFDCLRRRWSNWAHSLSSNGDMPMN